MNLTRRRVLACATGAVLAPPGAARATARAADFAALRRDLDGAVVLPGDADYAEARQLHQPRYDAVAPGAVAYPAHERDVAVCLAFARRTGVPLVPRGGGHGYAGWATGTGLVVDTGALAAVAADGDGAVRVGAGARLGDVNASLAARGIAVPTGLCPSVGIAGLTLGGGLGVSSRAYGATSDRLTGVRLVTPDGTVRDVDAAHDPELFWALRGGGAGNFGVAVEFRFRSHPVGDCAFAELHWPWRDAAALLGGWQRWLTALPDAFWSQVEFVVESGAGARSGARSGAGAADGGPVPTVRIVCLTGGRSDLDRQLTRLADLVGPRPQDVHVTTGDHGATMRLLAGCADRPAAQCRVPGRLPGHDPRGRLGRDDYAARSDFWPQDALSAPAVEVVLKALAEAEAVARERPGGGRCVVQFDGVCGGALNRVPPGATAFVHRTSAFLAQYLAYWPTAGPPEEAGRQQAWLNRLWRDLRPWAGGSAYQNYADPQLTDWRTAYYGANLARLEQVKRAVDPDRLFRFPQGV
ncbi:FAD-binding oxidoreductase [Streptomyces antimicrobicus]|uniref:FAD-binding oxidoreductase n=1 Tax=Streptomyces antimicrobicus TaxID=2883108 RepID=A0ABS8BB91_9ACTN|nr:FAD-binding oxidoreductase [Streptomyces antimicrobicus]MCB5181801.1 FAD-binding oxidoreductase [Streptomyces antimicrobicus]